MERDTQAKKEKQATTVEVDEPKMPTYEYQKDDARSFSIGCNDAAGATPHSRNNATLKVF
jgi:hypothetical protein